MNAEEKQAARNKPTWASEEKKTNKTFLRRPCWEIGGAEVDEKVPLPVQHGEQVLHAAQVGLQQAGAAPDGHHPPGRGSNVGVLLGDLQDLPVQVGGALSWTERSNGEINGRLFLAKRTVAPGSHQRWCVGRGVDRKLRNKVNSKGGIFLFWCEFALKQICLSKKKKKKKRKGVKKTLRRTELKGSGAKYGKGKKNAEGIKSQEGIKDEREAKEPASCQA